MARVGWTTKYSKSTKGEAGERMLVVGGWWLVVGDRLGGFKNRASACACARARSTPGSEFGWRVRFWLDRGGKTTSSRCSRGGRDAQPPASLANFVYFVYFVVKQNR